MKGGFQTEARLPQQKDILGTKGENYFEKRFGALKHFLSLINRRDLFPHTSCQVREALGHHSDSLICVSRRWMAQRGCFPLNVGEKGKASDWISCLAVKFTEVTIVK